MEPNSKPVRLVSLDAYRGFIMTTLAASGFGLSRVAQKFPDSGVWQFLGYETDHVAWRGCGFWDLIQPSFMFMVGVAVPYSYAARKAKGAADGEILKHTLWRSLLLVLLGVFLSSSGGKHTNWAFMNVLSQIGFGYTLVTLLRGKGLRKQAAALAGILVGTWLLFMLYPAPNAGIEGHFAKHQNFAAWFDHWFLNLFPPHEYVENEGGYQTLNFVPSMATMIFGLMAGELLRGEGWPTLKLRKLLAGAAACLVFGALVDPNILPGVHVGWTLCPIVKRLWTPSWAVFSTGWTLALLAGFYWLIDIKGYKRWAQPLVVVGMNSIAMYMMGQLMKGWVRQQLETHLGRGLFAGTYGPIWSATSVLLVLWLVCFWMYRRKIFLRI